MQKEKMNGRRTIEIGKPEELDYYTNEAFKALRTNVLFSGAEVKVITLTSCTPNEGKTSVSFQLAISLAESGKNVVFIDADLRKSVMAGRYKMSSMQQGLTHYLSGQAEQEDVLYSTSIERLTYVPTGPVPPNPSELLGSSRMQQLVERLREEADYIIIDAPPLGSVVDSGSPGECNQLPFCTEYQKAAAGNGLPYSGYGAEQGGSS